MIFQFLNLKAFIAEGVYWENISQDELISLVKDK